MTGEEPNSVVASGDMAKEDMPPSYEETAGLTGETVPEVKIAPSETKIDMKGEKEEEAGFKGLTKDELMKYANDPFWVRLRWIFFLLFWAVWVAMLVASVVIIVYAPKCPSPEPKEWWQKSPIYKVDLETFPTKIGDTPGTLASLSKSLDYLVGAGFGTVYLKTAGLGDLPKGETDFGSKADWDALVAGLKDRYQYLVVDYSPEVEYWLKNGVDGFVISGEMAAEDLKTTRTILDTETENSGSVKVLIDYDDTKGAVLLPDDSPIHVAIRDSEAPVPMTAANLKGAIDAYLDPAISWPGICLSSVEYGPEYVDTITMVKMLLPATLMFDAGEELGLGQMNWDAVKEQVSDVASHLSIFSTLSTKLRHQDAILFGAMTTNTTIIRNETVFGLTRVKKGNPGYLLAANLGATDTVVDFSSVEHVAGSIRVMAKTSSPEVALSPEVASEEEIRTFQSSEVPLKAMETKIFTFVPNFD